MPELDQIITWINTSDIADDKKAIVQDYLNCLMQEGAQKDFQIKRLESNLIINTRFLNKTVEDLEKTVILLKDSNHQLNNFTRIASHDLKSPLRSISSFSALLHRSLGGKLNPKQGDYLKIIESSAKSMSELIDDLLTFTRINEESLNIKEENISSLLKSVLQSLDFDIKYNKATIENKLPCIQIHCDPIKIKQVFQNLISNSIKFSSLDNNCPHIVIDLIEEDKSWVFSVEDNGIGIENKFKEIVFHEFQKLNGDTYDGTGMGLSIVKKIVKKHEGDIWVDIDHKNGTKILFTISKHLAIKNSIASSYN